MSAAILPFPYYFPEHLAPAFIAPLCKGQVNTADARTNIDKLLADQRQVWDWAVASGLAVLSINGDRNGAYLCVAPAKHIYSLFGDECAQIQRQTRDGLCTETWIGLVGHIRVFWREVKCVH